MMHGQKSNILTPLRTVLMNIAVSTKAVCHYHLSWVTWSTFILVR